MSRRPRDHPSPARPRGRSLALAVLGGLALVGCGQGALDPQGPDADRTLGIFWALLAAAAAVSVVVLLLWLWGSRRPGRDDPDARIESGTDSQFARRLVIVGGLVMPAVVLAAFFGVQVWGAAVEDTIGTEDLVIEVVGHQYWWEMHYRGLDGVDPFTTANQLHLPVDTRVTLVLRSEDVIHSFWIPQLGGKADMVPGRENRMVLSADEPGTYAGYCAEYCGLQHTWMKIEAVAMEPAAFDDWARQHATPAPPPTTAAQRQGRDVFLDNSCVGCHTIRGVSTVGDLGPDLTHLATRSELGAGILPLDEQNLRDFVADTQSIKPGARMPPQGLTGDELEALVAYLLSLE